MTPEQEKEFDRKFFNPSIPSPADLKSFIRRVVATAREEALREATTIVSKSRTIGEDHGIGIREEKARKQAIVDICCLPPLTEPDA